MRQRTVEAAAIMASWMWTLLSRIRSKKSGRAEPRHPARRSLGKALKLRPIQARSHPAQLEPHLAGEAVAEGQDDDGGLGQAGLAQSQQQTPGLLVQDKKCKGQEDQDGLAEIGEADRAA